MSSFKASSPRLHIHSTPNFNGHLNFDLSHFLNYFLVFFFFSFFSVSLFCVLNNNVSMANELSRKTEGENKDEEDCCWCGGVEECHRLVQYLD